MTYASHQMPRRCVQNLFKKKKRVKKRVSESVAIAVFESFNWHCAYCGVKPNILTIDHVIPQSQNGSNEINNLLPACRRCNTRKGAKSLVNWYNERNPRYSCDRWNKIAEALGLDDERLSA